MWYFIEELIDRIKVVDWSRMISDNLDKLFMNLEQPMTFNMSSYVVYLLARIIQASSESHWIDNCKRPLEFPRRSQ